jgi:hypothetical protein
MSALEPYCKHFFGYGRWDAPVWFLGLEEAGGDGAHALDKRVREWEQRGRRGVEDGPSFYPAVGEHRWHGPSAVLQPTWRQLIRILLIARNQPATDADILHLQKTQWGALTGDVCLTEILPLPAPNIGAWPYQSQPDAPWLASRDQFMQRFLLRRLITLRANIAAHRPRAVIFYFWRFRDYAVTIAGDEFNILVPEKLLGLSRNGIEYFITGHPARNPDDYFVLLGRHFHTHYPNLF